MKPKQHQEEAEQKGNQQNLIVIHCTGAGKTFTGLRWIRSEVKRTGLPAIVICPIKLISDAWLSDCKLFTPDLDMVSFYSTKPDQRSKRFNEDHEVYVTNYEGFKNQFKMITDRKFCVAIIDESAVLKSFDTQITKAALALAGFKFRKRKGVQFIPGNVPEKRFALSATPSPNSPMEYWSQTTFCTGPGGNIFSDNPYIFRGRYFNAIPLGRVGVNKYVFRKSMFEELCTKIASISHVALKDELGLPPVHHNIHYVELSQKERAAYNTLKNEWVLELKGETKLAANKLSELMSLRQIVSGFLYGDETHRIGTSKSDKLLSLMKDDEDQTITFINFKEEARYLEQAVKGCRVLSGDTKGDKDALIKAFKAGEFQHLIANRRSASHGLTFINSHKIRHLSLDHSYEAMAQSNGRIHRLGQKHDCQYDYIVAKDTLDEPTMAALSRKEEIDNSFLTCIRDIQRGLTPDFEACSSVFTESANQIMARMAFNHITQ